MKADFDGACARCPEDIARGDDIVPQGSGFIHRRCASGQDDDAGLVPVKKTAAKKAAAVEKKPPTVEPATGAGFTMTIPEIPDQGLLVPMLDEETYHGHPGSVSVTGLKLIRQAPALFDWERSHRTEKAVFDYGSAAHLYVLGTGPEVVELMRTHPDGTHTIAEDRRSPSVGEHAAAIREAGKLPLMAKDHAKVKAMAARIREHGLAMKLLEDGQSEVSAFKVDRETGVLRRGRADHLRKRVIVDYKSAANADPSSLHKVALSNGWYMQDAFYRDLFTDVTGVEIRDFLFLCQEKTAPYLVSVVRLDAKAVDLGRRHYTEALQRYRDCTDTGLWPGYQADGVIRTLTLPRFAFDIVQEA